MMATIGGVACEFVKGDPPRLKTRVIVWQGPGLTGYGAQTLGKGDAAFTVRAIKYGTATVVKAWHANLEAVQGTVLTIINDWGVSSTQCLVLRVGVLARTPALDGTGTARVRGEASIDGVQIRE